MIKISVKLKIYTYTKCCISYYISWRNSVILKLRRVQNLQVTSENKESKSKYLHSFFPISLDGLDLTYHPLPPFPKGNLRFSSIQERKNSKLSKKVFPGTCQNVSYQFWRRKKPKVLCGRCQNFMRWTFLNMRKSCNDIYICVYMLYDFFC